MKTLNNLIKDRLHICRHQYIPKVTYDKSSNSLIYRDTCIYCNKEKLNFRTLKLSDGKPVISYLKDIKPYAL